MPDLNDVMKKIGGGKSKSHKGLPKRTGNPNRKLRMKKSRERLPEKKLRHVLKRNGDEAAVKYIETQAIPVSTYRKVCHQQHQEPSV